MTWTFVKLSLTFVKLWGMKKLCLEGKITSFKSSKHFALSDNKKISKYWDRGIKANPKKLFVG